MKFIKPTEQWKEAILRETKKLLEEATLVEPVFTLNIKASPLTPDNIEPPVVKITAKASAKMWGLIHANDNKEIGWHGLVKRDGNTFTITDILMYPQMTTAATVTTDDEKYSNWINALEDDQFNQLRFHGHSHVNMATSPSGTDTNYQQTLIKDVKDFYIFGIFNLKHSYYLCIYDIENNIMYETEDINFCDYTLMGISWAKGEMETYVHAAPIITSKTNSASSPSQGYSYYSPYGVQYSQEWRERYGY